MIGTGGNFGLDWVATLRWNRWQLYMEYANARGGQIGDEEVVWHYG